jgi:cell division protein FtsL
VIQRKPAPEAPAPKARPPKHGRYRRRRRSLFAHYGSSARVLSIVALVLAPVMVYVMLTSNLTSLNYALANAESQRNVLQQDVQRLDDQVAHLESRERLSQVAAQLGMRDPAHFEIVTLAPPPRDEGVGGIAFLGWLRR